MFGIKLYEKYNKVKSVFQKPVLKFWCGKYKQMPGLPLFRRKPQIKLFKKYQSKNLDNKDANVYIFDPKVWIEKDGKPQVIHHNYPKGLNIMNSFAWKRNIRKVLRKLHLTWITPIIVLPMWLKFGIHNNDVCFQYNEDDKIEFLYPPQFTIILFGYAFTWWLRAPQYEDKPMADYVYWEKLLDYYFYNESLDNYCKKLI